MADVQARGAGSGFRQTAEPSPRARWATLVLISVLLALLAAMPLWARPSASSPRTGVQPTAAHIASSAGAPVGSTAASAASTNGASAIAASPAGAAHPNASAQQDARAANGDVAVVVLFTALYTSLGMLLLIGGGMYIALRDRQYLHYLGYVAAALALLLARNGQLYDIPGIGEFSRWGVLGLLALGNALAAAMVVTARGFAGLSRLAPTLDRLLKLFPIVPGLLALVCLFNLSGTTGILQFATTLAQLGSILLAIAATAVAWRHQQRLALPMLLMWLLVFVAGGLRAMVDAGTLAGDGWMQYADQVALVLNAVVMGMALTDHIIEFRLQRDRASLAKEQADASLKLERERLKFIEALHTTLRDAPSGDQEWLAFRRLLEVVRELVPQASSAVALHAFHDNDLLLCEPNTTRDDYQHLLATRSGAFKGISRSQLPMQLRVDAPAPVDGGQPELIQVAVVPLPLTTPAWGMLLIERRGWQGFEREELNVAAELAQKATRAIEDAANDRVMRINAEFDALTAVFNRRTMDNRLAAYFKESLVRRSSLAVLFTDLDHLKEINEVYGHAAGDLALKLLADVLKAHCGTAGVVGRYASDKFVVILPDFNPEQARRWAEAMRTDAMGRDVVVGNKTLRVGVSVGIASRLAEDAEVLQIIDRVEKALTASKRGGRGPVQAPPIQGVASSPAQR